MKIIAILLTAFLFIHAINLLIVLQSLIFVYRSTNSVNNSENKTPTSNNNKKKTKRNTKAPIRHFWPRHLFI